MVDGEHYFPVIKAALNSIERDLKYELLAIVYIGGTEKITDETDLSSFGFPVIVDSDPLFGIKAALLQYKPDLTIDLSDEPVVGYIERFKFASHILKSGVAYLGADFRFDPPVFHDVVNKPSISIIGTGKRVGKTAVSGYACRCLEKSGFSPLVVAMGRGGPEKPEVLEGRKLRITPQFLLKASEEGKHAASDHYEDALMSRVTTIGCRRCGGGMAGSPFISNVLQGAHLANKLEGELVVFEGSGSALPPIKTDTKVIVIGAHQRLEYVGGYFGAYRLLISDFAILTMCEEPMANEEKIKSLEEIIKEINPDLNVIRTIFRPRPLQKIYGKRVLLAVTISSEMNTTLKNYLEDEYGCKVIGISNNLSNRPKLREDLERHKGNFSVLLTELKAASVDVVTKMGFQAGVEVVYMDNEPVVIGGEVELKNIIIDLAKESVKRFRERKEVG